MEITWWGVGLAVLWTASVLLAYFLGKTVGLEDAWRRSSGALRREWQRAEQERRNHGGSWQKWTD